MDLIKYPSIEQFRNVVYSVNHNFNYIGKDEHGDPIYDTTRSKPKLTFKGTIKLHGTSAGVCYNDKDMWVQSHKQIISPGNDNAGFAQFVEFKKEAFKKLFEEIKKNNDIDTSQKTICLYGEWAGKGIQSGVAINNIEKTLFIIGIKISEEELKNYSDITEPEIVKVGKWINCEGYRDNENRIYNVHDFKTYTIEIDFNHPELSQNKIIEQTLEVEDECPVSKAFGFSGIGEGIVYTYQDDVSRYIFKSKGLLHSKLSKVKVLKPVDNEKVNARIEMAEKATPTWRLEQFLTEVCDLNNGGEIQRSKIAEYIRAVMADIVKEELDVLSEAGIELKEINKYVSNICRDYFFSQEKI